MSTMNYNVYDILDLFSDIRFIALMLSCSTSDVLYTFISDVEHDEQI